VGFLLVTIIRFKISARGGSAFDGKDLSKLKQLGKINYATGLFILAGIISTFVAPDKHVALGQLKAFILEPVLMFYAIILTVKEEGQVYILLRAMFAATALISLFGIFQYYSLIHLPLRFWGNGSEVRRIVSVFEYPNALSLYLAPLIGLFTFLEMNGAPILKNKWLSLIGLLLMDGALLLTFSRGAWAAVLIVTVLVMIKQYGIKKFIFPIILLLLTLLIIPPVQQRLSMGLGDPSSEAHFSLMRLGVDQILMHPFLGLGLGGFASLKQEVNYPHNIFLNFWIELGLLGLIAFGSVVVSSFQRTQKNPSILTYAAAVSLLILIIHGLIDVPYFKNDLSLLFWFIISLFYI
jgi:putative inorganic carbon (hco3(-)) transporter